MKTKVVTQISIAAGVADVFRYLTDLKYHHLWNPQVRRISNHGKLKLGGGFESVSLLLGVEVHTTNVVTKFVPQKELQIANSAGLVHYTANFRLAAKDGGTTVICSTEVATKSNAFAFAAPILKALARRELQTDMQALKIAVEHKLQ